MKGKHSKYCAKDTPDCQCNACANDYYLSDSMPPCCEKHFSGACLAIKACPDFTPETEETIKINWYSAMTQEQKDIYNAASNWGCF